jgi:hypothetical protein
MFIVVGNGTRTTCYNKKLKYVLPWLTPVDFTIILSKFFKLRHS